MDHSQINTILYGTASFVICIILTVLTKNLFFSKPSFPKERNKKKKRPKRSKPRSRSYPDYSKHQANNLNEEMSQKEKNQKYIQRIDVYGKIYKIDIDPEEDIDPDPDPMPTDNATPNSQSNTMSSNNSETAIIPQFIPNEQSVPPLAQIESDIVKMKKDISKQYDTETDIEEIDIDNDIHVHLPKISAKASRENSINKSHRRSNSHSFSISNFKLPRISAKLVKKLEYGQHDHSDIAMSIRLTSLFGCVCMLFSLLVITIYFSTKSTSIYLILSSLLLYGLSKFMSCICTLCRTYFTFANSVLQYSKYIYIGIVCIMCIHCCILMLILFMLFYNKSVLSAIYCAAAFYLFDIVYNVTLYALFTKRMWTLFENTSSYIAQSKAKGRRNTSFDFSREIADKSMIDIIAPSPVGTPQPKKSSDGGIELAVGHNLTVQIEHIQESDFSAALTPSPRSPGTLKIIKSRSADMDVAESNVKNKPFKRAESFSNLFKSTENREHSQSKRELSKIKRTQKREKWKYYQKQQASGNCLYIHM